MTRAAKATAASKINPLAATRRPVSGLGVAIKALLSAPVARMATPTRTQNERLALRLTEILFTRYIPRCCLTGVKAIRMVSAVINRSTMMAMLITTGRRRQYRLGLRSTKGRIISSAKKTNSP